MTASTGVRPAETIAELAARGELLRSHGRPAVAEPLLREALALAEREGADRPRPLVEALNAFGLLCKDLARYDEAHTAYERALALLDAMPTPDRGAVATLYHNLGGIEHARGNFDAAEPLARKGLEIRRGIAVEDDPELAADMIALAAILDGQDKFDEALSLYSNALASLEKNPAANAHVIGVALNDLGAQYARLGRLGDAEALLARAVELKTRTLDADHPDVAISLNNLAFAREQNGDLARAVVLYEQAVAICDAALGSEHPRTRDCRRNYERARALNSRM